MQAAAAMDEDQWLARTRGERPNAKAVDLNVALDERHEATLETSCALSTLPAEERGSCASRMTCRGYLNPASRSRQCSTSSSGLAIRSARSTTNAVTSSPNSGCG